MLSKRLVTVSCNSSNLLCCGCDGRVGLGERHSPEVVNPLLDERQPFPSPGYVNFAFQVFSSLLYYDHHMSTILYFWPQAKG